jgi:hypothetical protein
MFGCVCFTQFSRAVALRPSSSLEYIVSLLGFLAFMDYQDQLFEKEDGRYYAIDKFRARLASITTAEKLKRNVVSFGLPSGSALFLHLAHRAYLNVKDIDPLSLFDRHDQGTWPDDQSQLFDFLEDSISHSVFAFTALEAFANESIPNDFKYTFKAEKDGEEKVYVKDEIERKINLDEKLHIILPNIYNVLSRKGKKVWGITKRSKKCEIGSFISNRLTEKLLGQKTRQYGGLCLGCTIVRGYLPPLHFAVRQNFSVVTHCI